MICKKCGRVYADDMLFCPACGSGLEADKMDYSTDKNVPEAKMPGDNEANYNVNADGGDSNNPHPYENAAPVQQPFGQQQVYGQPTQFYGQPPYGQPYYAPAPRQNGWEAVRNAVKRVAASPVFLLAIILFTFSQTAGLIYSLTSIVNISSVIIDLEPLMELFELADVDVPHDFYEAVRSVSFGSMIISSIPTFVMIAGMFATYVSARRREPGMSTAGLTMIQALVVITFSAICLLLLLVLALVGLAALSLAVTPDEMEGGVAVGISIIVIALLGIAAAVISYYIGLIRTISAVKGSVMSGIPQIRGSMMYVAVVNFIVGGIAAVSSLPSALFGGDIIVAVFDLVAAVATILFGVAIVMYRSSMKELTYTMMYPNNAGYVQR